MSRYVIARLAAVVPTVLVLVGFVVILVRLLPGNAVDVLLQEQAQAGDVQRAELESRLGLDKSLPEAYFDYVVGLAQGDLGASIWSQRPVTEIVLGSIFITLEIALLSLIVASIIGILVGTVSAVSQGTLLDYALRCVAVAGMSIPYFALGTMVLILPAVWFGWSPSLLYTPLSEDPWGHISQFLIPAAVLGVYLSATLMRIMRTMMLEVLRMDYVRTARAKGLSGPVVVTRHAVRNALIPVISLLGLQVAFLMSGSVIIENIFALPGMGRELINAIAIRDYPVVQGITVVTGLLVIFVNLLVDLSYGWLDPRTRVG